MSCDIPVEIVGSECVARALNRRFHFKSNLKELKWQAFKPKAGTDDLSVMRASHLSSNQCKVRAKKIPGAEHYVGFACLRVADVLATAVTLHDSREEFCGHAHIAQGFVIPAGEPPAPQILELLEDRCSRLKAIAVLHIDQDPAALEWTGAALST